MAEREYSETRWLHDILTATAQAVYEHRPVDHFEVEFERDRGADEHDLGTVYSTEVTFRVRFAGDVTIRPGEPSPSKMVAGLAKPLTVMRTPQGAPVRYSAERGQLAWDATPDPAGTLIQGGLDQYRVVDIRESVAYEVPKQMIPDFVDWPHVMLRKADDATVVAEPLTGGQRFAHPATVELEKLLTAGRLGPLDVIAEEVSQAHDPDVDFYDIVRMTVEKVRQVINNG